MTEREAPAYYSAAEAAEVLGVSVRTFERYVKSGRIEVSHRTLGGYRRFSREHIEAQPTADREHVA